MRVFAHIGNEDPGAMRLAAGAQRFGIHAVQYFVCGMQAV
jgi:hypothetical protein